MTELQKAKLILIRNGYKFVKSNKMDESQRYLNEGAILDKVKDAYNWIKGMIKSDDPDENAEGKTELKALAKEVDSSKDISPETKKTIFKSMLGPLAIAAGIALTGVSNANAGVCQINQTVKDGVMSTQIIGDCSKQDIEDLQNYKSKAQGKLGIKSEQNDKENAKHLAVMFNSSNSGSLKVVAQQTQNKGKSSEQRVVRFSDGTGLVATKSGYLFFYGANSDKIVGQYTPDQAGPIYNMAKAIAHGK